MINLRRGDFFLFFFTNYEHLQYHWALALAAAFLSFVLWSSNWANLEKECYLTRQDRPSPFNFTWFKTGVETIIFAKIVYHLQKDNTIFAKVLLIGKYSVIFAKIVLHFQG